MNPLYKDEIPSDDDKIILAIFNRNMYPDIKRVSLEAGMPPFYVAGVVTRLLRRGWLEPAAGKDNFSFALTERGLIAFWNNPPDGKK